MLTKGIVLNKGWSFAKVQYKRARTNVFYKMINFGNKQYLLITVITLKNAEILRFFYLSL